MIIRQANIDDLEEILMLFVDTINSTCKNEYTKEQIEVWTASAQNKEKWKNKIITQYFIVADIHKEIVGFGSLENDNYIDLIYVHKDHLRKGVANRILNTLKNKAQEYGNKYLTSDVSKTARPFFERNGFKVVKENEFDLNGVLISNYEMTNKASTQQCV